MNVKDAKKEVNKASKEYEGMQEYLKSTLYPALSEKS